MKGRKWWLGSLLTAALLVSAGSGYAMAADDLHNSVHTEPTQPRVDQQKHHRKHLTQEQKEMLKQAGVDLKALKQAERQLRQTVHSIRQQAQVLRTATQDDPDRKQQVKADLQSVKQEMKQVRALRQENRQLRQTLREAVQAKDTAKIKDAYGKLLSNQQQALKLLQSVESAMKAEVAKLQG